jgi:hypothetical protein
VIDLERFTKFALRLTAILTRIALQFPALPPLQKCKRASELHSLAAKDLITLF